MKRLSATLAALCLGLGVLVAVGSPAEASLKHFRFVSAKVMQEPGDRSEWTPPTAVLCVGHLKSSGSSIDQRCLSYASAPDFVPSVGSFAVTFRWFAGRTVIAKRYRIVRKNTGSVIDQAPTRYLSANPSVFSGAWRWKGKPLSLTITITKKGYATKVIRIANTKFTNLDD